MGRLPSTYEGRVIQQRIPYSMTGEFTMTSGLLGQQYPDATFQNTNNKPFEIHRVIPRVIPQLANRVMFDPAFNPDQDLLASLIRLNIEDLGLNQPITKSPTIINTMTKGSAERTWEWADPHYLPNNAQLKIELDALVFPVSFTDNIDSLKVATTIQGFLLVVGPPIA